MLYHHPNVCLNLLERRFPPKRDFVHVNASINFYLDRMDIVRRVAVMLGRIAARIRIVADNSISSAGQKILYRIGQ